MLAGAPFEGDELGSAAVLGELGIELRHVLAVGNVLVPLKHRVARGLPKRPGQPRVWVRAGERREQLCTRHPAQCIPWLRVGGSCLHAKLRHGAVGVHARDDHADEVAANDHRAQFARHAIPVTTPHGQVAYLG